MVPRYPTKSCTECGVDKPLSEFRRKRTGKYGRQSSCKPCSNAKLDVWRAKAREQRLAYNREYYATARGREVISNYQARKPAKKVAQLALQRAIERGLIVRPERCEDCNGTNRVEGHHNDYAKPLEVRWLCRICHKAWHRKHGEAANADMPATLNMGIRKRQLERKAARLNLIPKMLAGGMTQKSIAMALGVSRWTISMEARQCAAG